MNWKFANSIVGGIAALLIAALLLVACTSPHGSVGATGSWGDFNFEGYIGNDGRTHWEGNGPHICVCIEFLDKDNNVIGSGTMSDGSGAGVVNGRAVMWRAKQIKCEDLAKCGQNSSGGNGGGSGGGGVFGIDSDDAIGALAFAPRGPGLQSQHVSPQANREWQRVWCGTIEIDDTTGGGLIHNGSGVFDVLVGDPNSNEAFLAVWPIMQVGPGAPVSPNVKIGFMSQCLPETFGGRMVFARRAPFVSFVANVNGVNNYAVLGQDVVDLSIGNGWHIIEVVVPLTDMNLLPGTSNTVEVFSKAIGESALRYDRGTSILMP